MRAFGIAEKTSDGSRGGSRRTRSNANVPMLPDEGEGDRVTALQGGAGLVAKASGKVPPFVNPAP
jgi:hypothetical protein